MNKSKETLLTGWQALIAEGRDLFDVFPTLEVDVSKMVESDLPALKIISCTLIRTKSVSGSREEIVPDIKTQLYL